MKSFNEQSCCLTKVLNLSLFLLTKSFNTKHKHIIYGRDTNRTRGTEVRQGTTMYIKVHQSTVKQNKHGTRMDTNGIRLHNNPHTSTYQKTDTTCDPKGAGPQLIMNTSNLKRGAVRTISGFGVTSLVNLLKIIFFFNF